MQIQLGWRNLPASATPEALQAGSIRFYMTFYYTYVLKSRKDNKLYIGWTNNLKSRFENHNKGLVLSTKHRIPLDLIYYETCLSKEKAIHREKQLKTGFGRSYISKRT